MKRFGLMVLAVALALPGCAQKGKGKQQVSEATRLDSIEASFARFQEQQRARDADIDNRLRDIASRLDRLGTGKPPVAKASRVRLRGAVATSAGVPIVAGQVIPYASLVAPTQPRPAPLAPQPLPPQPVVPPAAAPAVPPAAAAPSQSLPSLQPPVVTLGDSTGQPAALTQPRTPQPVAPAPRGKARASARSPQPLASTAPAAAAPAPTAPAAQAPSADIQEQLLYTEALRAVSANRNDEGRKKFNDFLAKYPNSAKTPEALYWIGESYMGDKSYNQAILSFKEVVDRFPKDSKAAEALLRSSEAYERLGDKANAAAQLKLLVSEHPNSELAGKAKQKLKQLGQ